MNRTLAAVIAHETSCRYPRWVAGINQFVPLWLKIDFNPFAFVELLAAPPTAEGYRLGTACCVASRANGSHAMTCVLTRKRKAGRIALQLRAHIQPAPSVHCVRQAEGRAAPASATALCCTFDAACSAWRVQCSPTSCVFEPGKSSLPCPRIHLEISAGHLDIPAAPLSMPPPPPHVDIEPVLRPMPSTALDCAALELLAKFTAAPPPAPTAYNDESTSQHDDDICDDLVAKHNAALSRDFDPLESDRPSAPGTHGAKRDAKVRRRCWGAAVLPLHSRATVAQRRVLRRRADQHGVERR